ncbi:DUF6310 domain-containing protein [Corallococcus sp. AB030]|uniref:DUF6310 domain-containing protein n=1 Tax=Corallococcus sp. AB030 TaxID=2316716 RepID=UPI001F16366F|nr:DUF6310 domain-containing protein [Corallococcus sp. AB030]
MVEYVAMRVHACIAVLLLLSACAASTPGPKGPASQSEKLANLQRAAELPWKDEGQCVVQEASRPWPEVVERCFHTLDTRRIRFRDTERQCPVATADAAALEMMVGVCLLTQPELVVGAVVVIGVVMVGVAIAEALEAESWKGVHSEDTPVPVAAPISRDAVAKRRPQPEPSAQDWFPPGSPPEPRERARRPECTPQRIPPKGGNRLHNQCADRIPDNAFRGANVLVNGKAFDALQLATRKLWEVKTTAIETYTPYIQDRELEKQVQEGLREQALAAACGYTFVIGVRTEAHQKMLEEAAPTLTVVLMPWC